MTAPPTCTSGKALYHDKRVAEAVAKRQASLNGYPIYIYWCPEHHAWHLTKTNPATYKPPPDLQQEQAPKPESRYPPGHWTRMRMTEAEKLAEVAREKHCKKQLNRVDERWRRWRGCLMLSSKEHAKLKSIGSIENVRAGRESLRRELILARAELAVLHGQLQRIDSAWLDRGRYVKSDVIEEALREFHGWRSA